MGWWLNRTGQPEGPYEDAQVLHLIHSGQLRGGAICQHGSNAWMPIEQHPTFGAALRGAPAFAAPHPPPQAGFAPHAPRPAPAKGRGGLIALVVGIVVALALVGVGVRYLKWKSAQDDKDKERAAAKTLDRKEAKKRADAFEPALAAIKKIDPASAPSIESDGYTVKGVRPGFADSTGTLEDNNDLVVHAEDLKSAVFLGDVAYRAGGTTGLQRCASSLSWLQDSKNDKTGPPEDFMRGCTKIQYLWVIRTRDVVKPKITDVTTEGNTRTHKFDGGKIEGDVIGFDLKNGQPIGGFRFSAESSEQPPIPQSGDTEKALDDDLKSQLTKALEDAASKTWKP